MSACRLEVSSTPSTPEALEDYYQYLDMEDRIEESDDVYAQLAQKEKDLYLAAEIGKSLLEKNEELQRKNEQYDSLHKDLQHKIDDLEQERYRLRLRLESAEGEYENTIKDLQTEISLLRNQYDDEVESSKQRDDDRLRAVAELRSQNERLTDQLKKSMNAEEDLNNQLTGLRLQVSSRRSSIQNHVTELSMLREEISVLTERVRELEKRIRQLTEERDASACNSEESQDRIMMLEKQKMEQDQRIRIQEREIVELREANSDLQEKLEELSLNASSPGEHYCTNNDSLFNELEMSNCFSEDMDLGRPQSGMSGMKVGGAYPMSPSPGLSLEYDDDIEYDDEYIHIEPTQMVSVSDEALQQEVIEAYRQIKSMFTHLKSEKENLSQSPEQRDFSDFERGSLSNLLTDLHSLMEDITKKQATVESAPDIHKLQEKVHVLQEELYCNKNQLHSLHSVVKNKDEELKMKSQELQELSQKLHIEQQELEQIRLERDRLNDQIGVDEDVIVAQARHHRDAAVAKRNSMEVELVNAKLDLANLDQQLLESIQQKIELSQQLEQCQLDMQELLQQQISKRVETELEADDKIPPKTERRRKNFWN